MSLVVNPTNPLNMAAFSTSALQSNTALGQKSLHLYYTSNGGASWSLNIINSADDTYTSDYARVDPSVAFDDEGKLYICYGLFYGGTSSLDYERLIVARSDDGGGSSSSSPASILAISRFRETTSFLTSG